MKIKIKCLMLLVVFFFVHMPSFALLDAKISKSNYYDTVSTLMKETDDDILKIKNDNDFWSKNNFRGVKYRPTFLLSNKELYKVVPESYKTIPQRYVLPSIYNISLKKENVITLASLQPKSTAKLPTKNINTESKIRYETAKNSNIEIEEKISTSIWLKNNKNYFQAIDLLNDVIKEEPYNAYAYYLKAEIYAQKHETDNAMKNYIQALKINPSSKQCCLGIAKILEPTNKLLAQKYYEKAK